MEEIHLYSLGSPVIDIPLGGGMQSGKIIEVRGPESVGKSTISIASLIGYFDYWLAKKVAIEELEVLWCEVESAFDITRISYIRPDIAPYINRVELNTVEALREEIQYYIQDRKFPGFVGVDTLAALQTKAQQEAEDPFAGGQMEVPRLLRAMMRHITVPLGQAQTTLLLVNQTYDGSKDNPNNRFEKPKPQSYGGGAVKYYSSCRLDLQKGQDVMETFPDGSEVCTHILTKGYTIKNKLIRPRMRFNVYIENEKGFDAFKTLTEFLKENGIIKVTGGWKTIEYLENPVKKSEEAKMAKLKFQSADCKELKEAIEKIPHLQDWLDYQVYLFYANQTPLTKIKLIRKIFEYEKKFFGKKVTEFTEREQLAAKAEEKAIELQAQRDEERASRGKKKKKSKKEDKPAAVKKKTK